MSGWTILTVRAREGAEYHRARYDDQDTWQASADICATMDEDERVRRWTTWSAHVYAYLNCERYDFDFALNLLDEYGEMVKDAVVLGANDTTDTGEARYYSRRHSGTDEFFCSDEYRETQGEDGNYVGEIALSVMNARHGIVARDPFHNEPGLLDERYVEDGESQL